MDKTLRKVIKDAIEQKKKCVKDGEVWLKQDMESLEAYRKAVVEKNVAINTLKTEINALEKVL